MKTVYIMRGVPGSGKSTRAKSLVGTTGVIHSTDDYFYVDGLYRFDPAQLKANHDKNYAAFCSSLQEGVEIVIVDNTNVRRWQYQRYVDAARDAGYTIEIIVMQHPDPQVAADRNIHGVPLDTIQRMIAEWEH